MTRNTDGAHPFQISFDLLEQSLNGAAEGSLHQIRRRAIDRVVELGLPTLRDEEWRYTSLLPLTEAPFHTVIATEIPALSASDVADLSFEAGSGHRLVFVNGAFQPSLSHIGSLPGGAVVESLADAIASGDKRVVGYLANIPESRNDVFLALNTAFIRDGAFIYIPNGVTIDVPIHLVYISSSIDESIASHPRTVMIFGEDVRATVIEEYTGREGMRYFTNPATELLVGCRSQIRHYKLQHESVDAVHIGTLRIKQDAASTVTTATITFGSALVRNNSVATLAGEGAHCTMDGLYVVGGTQHVDNHTTIDHAVACCTSHELYKGVLDDKGRGVFSGKIIVRQDAQKTDSKQSNKNLLLSDNAVIDTKPQLEIFADDVKCTHGATIGQLDEDAIFYLRARGIGHNDAKSILTFAYATEVIDHVEVDAARIMLDRLLSERMNRESVAHGHDIVALD